MSPEVLLLALRILAAACLCVFFGLVGYQVWRDLRWAAVELQEAPNAHLLGLDDPVKGLGLDLEAMIEIGRTVSNPIRIDDETVSAEHARIFYQGGQWWVEDLASRNGTWVNEIKLEQPLVITYGDVIRLGKVSLRLERGSAGPALSPPTQGLEDS